MAKNGQYHFVHPTASEDDVTRLRDLAEETYMRMLTRQDFDRQERETRLQFLVQGSAISMGMPSSSMTINTGGDSGSSVNEGAIAKKVKALTSMAPTHTVAQGVPKAISKPTQIGRAHV